MGRQNNSEMNRNKDSQVTVNRIKKTFRASLADLVKHERNLLQRHYGTLSTNRA